MSGQEIRVPLGPLEVAPDGVGPGREMWRHALRGLELGRYDEWVVRWVEALDDTTMVSLASLIERARRAGEAR